jgi:nitrogen regulatory protein PII
VKKIEAIVEPHVLESIQKVVEEAGRHSMCVMEAGGIGGRDGMGQLTLAPLVKIEIYLEDHEAERVADAIAKELGGKEVANVFLTKIDAAMKFL